MINDKMMVENEALKLIIQRLFPGYELNINDVPDEFTRPCFVFIDPSDKVDTRELNRFMVRQTKTITLYQFFEEDNIVQGEADTQAMLDYLRKEPKHQLPDLDRRYMTVEASCSINKVTSLATYTIRVMRTIPRDLGRPQVPKIDKIKHTIQEIGGEKVGKKSSSHGG